MSRYIDADAIEDKAKQYSLGYYEEDEWAVPFKEITSAPSIDIVRCGECKHNYNTAINHGKMQPKCYFTDYKLTENDFCSRGEREGE